MQTDKEEDSDELIMMIIGTFILVVRRKDMEDIINADRY